LKAVKEFGNYITANQSFIPNYGDRYRHGETISTAFVESTVNYVVSKRMVKKQQMRWSERGAHLLLQVRTQVLNEDLQKTFHRWYPGMQIRSGESEQRKGLSPRFVPPSIKADGPPQLSLLKIRSEDKLAICVHSM
jgi:hypothetical protein